MSFKMKYDITPMYLPINSKRRSGIKMPRVSFIVAHDTGNKNSTAKQNIQYYINSAFEQYASAHIFVDDTGIYECIPALTGVPEKAWHVLYEKTFDNELFGDDSNDIGVGVEYAFGDNINADESYKRFIWVMAYIAYKFNLDPSNTVIGHMILDPQRKTDPTNGFKQSGRSYEQMLKDVVAEYKECTQTEVKIELNGKHVANGLLIDNTTYVPLRVVGQTLPNCKIGWNNTKKLPSVNNKEIDRFKLINSTSYIALRDCGEILNLSVGWNNETKTAILRTK
jgi:N-acetylmuramoyl-L-alanine amidase